MNKNIYNDDRFSINDKLPGETVLHDKLKDKTHFLNKTAFEILTLAYKGLNAEKIEEIIRSRFIVDGENGISKEIEETIAVFRKNELI